MAKLVALSEGLKGQSYELKTDSTTIGRLEDNTFQIQEPSVSSHHCEIFLRGSDVVIKDLNSTNGTYINGEKIAEASLKAGQVLRLGQVELRLENGAGTRESKVPLEQTRALAGVKLNEFTDLGTRQVTFEKSSPFTKKSNKTAIIFISLFVALVVIVIVVLVIALQGLK